MNRAQIFFRILFSAILAFVSLEKLPAASWDPSQDFEAPHNPYNYATTQMPTNWIADVKAILPSEYFTNGNFDFNQVTNLLCQESQRGNAAAQGLWGISIVGQSRSPDETAAGLRTLLDSAWKGYVPAMYNLGLLYESGNHMPKDYDQAFHWFGLAATNGSSDGLLQLGACYHYGMGTTPDLAMAANCYQLSAEKTNYVAMKSYGYFLINGIGVKTNLDTAKYWLTRAANEGGNRRAMYDLGAIAIMKFPNTNAMVEAFQWYQKSADLGDAMACEQLAYCYYNGWGVPANRDDYYHWLSQAAALGATDAQYMLGAAYRTGNGVPKDAALSLIYYRKAAAKNHPSACYDLALHYLADKTNKVSQSLASYCMLKAAEGGHREAQLQCAFSYFRGDLLPQDCNAGNQWLAKAAENGWPNAEYILFQVYYYGIAPTPNCPAYPKDKTEALKWLRRAAEHGDFRAESTFAVELIKGTDVEQDIPEAEKLLRDAAGHGYADAQNDLGFAIMHGDIGSTDWVEAAMWCQLAKDHWPNPKTQELVDANLFNVSARLSPEEKFEVDQRVKNFKPLPIAPVNPLIKDWNKNPAYQMEDGRFGH